jgi:hypothetical protein
MRRAHLLTVASVGLLMGCQWMGRSAGPSAGLYLHVVNESDGPVRVVGLDDRDGPGGNAPPGLVGGCEAFTEELRPGPRSLLIFDSVGLRATVDLTAGPATADPPTRTIVIAADGSIDTDAAPRPIDQRPCPHPGFSGGD